MTHRPRMNLCGDLVNLLFQDHKTGQDRENYQILTHFLSKQPRE